MSSDYSVELHLKQRVLLFGFSLISIEKIALVIPEEAVMERGNKQYNKNSYYASDSNTKRPYVPKNKPHQSLLDQARSQQEVSARTNKLNGKKNA